MSRLPSALLLPLMSLACAPDVTPTSYAPYDYDAGPATVACLPNLDGSIVASQMQPEIYSTEYLLVSPPDETRAVDLVGMVNGMGNQEWDWSAPDPTDQVAPLMVMELTGKWYAESFPNGQYVVPIDVADTTEGIYRTTDSAVELQGLASREENPSTGQTLLVYDSPVQLYQFPIEPGRSWTVTGTSEHGMLDGLEYAGVDTYAVSVDASGILALPDLTFTQVMRVRTNTTVTPAAGIAYSTRQVSFFTQCYGEVARATSVVNEPQENFTTAAEVRRLGLPGE